MRTSLSISLSLSDVLRRIGEHSSRDASRSTHSLTQLGDAMPSGSLSGVVGVLVEVAVAAVRHRLLPPLLAQPHCGAL
eukprot:5290250-Pyramimonas_sp.AAC.1